uniref:Uncharacterized protein n=1 Tax=Arion vulgaris TaxID=1028688 RepID=A0A0B6YQT5_9EUPU
MLLNVNAIEGCANHLQIILKKNEFVDNKIPKLADQQEALLAVVKRHKLVWFRHVNRHDFPLKNNPSWNSQG